MQWYYVVNGERIGPIEDDALQQLVAGGQIADSTLVWNPDLPDWRPYGALVGDAKDETLAPALTTCICTECRAEKPADEVSFIQGLPVCAVCKPVFCQRLRTGTLNEVQKPYGRFGIRFVAKIIDLVLLGAVALLFNALFLRFGGDSDTGVFFVLSMAMGMVNLVMNVAYNTWFVGRFGATPGKMACGLQVVMPDGSRVSYLRALGRGCAELISSAVLYLGYFTVLFDDQRRALHDFICDTRVVRIS